MRRIVTVKNSEQASVSRRDLRTRSWSSARPTGPARRLSAKEIAKMEQERLAKGRQFLEGHAAILEAGGTFSEKYLRSVEAALDDRASPSEETLALRERVRRLVADRRGPGR